MGGLYDYVIGITLNEPFKSFKFDKMWYEEKGIVMEGLPTSVYRFDHKVRGRMFGHNGPHNWYRATSSDRYIPLIQCPLMVWVSKDDKICKYKHLPREDLLRNPNCYLIEARHGGHCDFFSKGKGIFNYKRQSTGFIIKFFDGISEFK